MRDNDSDGFFLGLSAGLTIAFVVGIIAYDIGKEAIEKPAIEAGCAIYTVDPKTGRTEWQWTCGEEPKE